MFSGDYRASIRPYNESLLYRSTVRTYKLWNLAMSLATAENDTVTTSKLYVYGGDKMFKQQEYVLAKLMYEVSNSMNPNEYTDAQITKCMILQHETIDEETILTKILDAAEREFANGNKEKARELYKRASEINPTNHRLLDGINKLE